MQAAAIIESAPVGGMQKVRIVLGGLTRAEYSEILEVPVGITEADLDRLVSQRYQEVDGGQFQDDPHYWERGECYWEKDPDSDHAQIPNGVVTFGPDGAIEVTEATAPEALGDAAPDWRQVMHHFGLDESFQWSDAQVAEYTQLYRASAEWNRVADKPVAAASDVLTAIGGLERLQNVLMEAYMALDDASGIVDAGENEIRAYEGPLARLKALRQSIERVTAPAVTPTADHRFFKTIFRVEVLSERSPVSDLGLEAIAEAIDAGDCVGAFDVVAVQGLSATEAAAALEELGSEPGFFRLDEEDDDEPVADPVVAVRSIDSGDWGEWAISQNLTDRWGEINSHDAAKKPLRELEADPELLPRLRAQMWDEITFITRKDGQFGVLFEVEYCSIESETKSAQDMGETTAGMKPHSVVIAALMKGLQQLQPEFPGVSFAIPHESQVVDDRPAAWAFVPDGLLDEQQRMKLGRALLDL